MRAVEVSFEAVAGAGASQVYTRLALHAMSRHFRCLRDALVAQVRALRKAMGERDGGGGGPGAAAAAAAGATKGDTPRLKVLDQCLRQQRAFQHPGTIENYPWRPQRGLPERAVAVLRAWLFEHFLHPYVVVPPIPPPIHHSSSFPFLYQFIPFKLIILTTTRGN
jgi:hypothetical protein